MNNIKKLSIQVGRTLDRMLNDIVEESKPMTLLVFVYRFGYNPLPAYNGISLFSDKKQDYKIWTVIYQVALGTTKRMRNMNI